MRRSRPALLRLVVVAVVLTLAAVAVVLQAGLTGPDPARIASRLPVPAQWEQTRDDVVGRSPLCLGGDRCPSVHRSWTADEPVTNGTLAEMFTGAGWSMSIDGSCTIDAAAREVLTRTDYAYLCTADGTVDGMDVRIQLGTADPSGVPVDVDVWVN